MSDGRRVQAEEDYGLPEGVTFEPMEDQEEPFNLAAPHVMTVLGPVDPAALGVTLPHEHLSGRPGTGPEQDPDCRLDDPHATLAEIEDFHAAGGGALVDVATAASGRDVQALLWIAARAPAHLIASTGHVTGRGARAPANGTSVATLAAAGIQEIRDGIEGSGARAGLIVAGTTLNAIGPTEHAVLQAAAQSHRETGVPVSLHSPGGAMAMEQIAVLQQEGVEAGRVIVEHLGSSPDDDVIRRVLATTAFVTFDQVGKGEAGADERLARRISAFAGLGYTGQLLVSPDFDRRSLLRAYGGRPGWVSIIERFTLLLMEAGLGASAVRQLLADNPQRALTIQRETAT